MREPLEIVINQNGLTLYHPSDPAVYEFIAREEKGVGARIKEFIEKVKAAPATLYLFVAEDLLFFKLFQLPLDTANIDEAVGYQLEMVTPFTDEPTWHSYSAVRGEESYLITLYAARSGYIDAYIQEIMEGQFVLTGLYPESQRYVTRLNRKEQWGLLLPGRFFKAFVFDGQNLSDRLLCSAVPSFAEAVDVCKTDRIYLLDPDGGSAAGESADKAPPEKPFFDYLNATQLNRHRPLLKNYNMLPASYRRPDYLKIVIAVLAVLNIVTLLVFGGVKVYKLKVFDSQVDSKIEKIMPLVNEMKELRSKETEYLTALAQLDTIGTNVDLINFISQLTAEMPSSSYVDQMRMDDQSNTINIQGYTEDVNALTSALQNIGDTQLKSTSRRKNKTYFHVEISLP